ncbi:hypothetical protein JS608_00011 [Bacillus amyloliquefaciens]|nr:hypothetical protein JS608_00011 [Bacillus amyloliquefaciens]
MDDPNLTFSRQRRYVFVILAIYLLGYGLTAYKTVFLGLFLELFSVCLICGS